MITSFNGIAVTDWDQLRELIRDNADGTAVIGYERDGEALTGDDQHHGRAAPRRAGRRDACAEVGFLGVTPTTHLVTTGGPLYTLEQMDEMAVDTVQGDGGPARQGVGRRQGDRGRPGARPGQPGQHRRRQPVLGRDRLQRRARGHREARLLRHASSPASTSSSGCSTSSRCCRSTAATSPAPSGRRVRRGFARLRGRPDPGYVDAAKLLPVAYVVASCLLVLSLVLIVGDIVVPVRLT